MYTSMKDSTKAVVYTALVLLLAVGFSFIPGMNTFVYMMTPTIAVLLMLLVVTRDGYRKASWSSLGLHKLGVKGWVFALVVPIIPIAVSFGIVWACGLSVLQPGDSFEGMDWGWLPLLIVFLYVKAVLTQSLGEELGWRGYLLPLMVNSMNTRKAMLLNGFIHGIWHFPLILNTAAYHADEKLWLILPMTVLSTVFLGPVIGQLRLRTGSVWPASMMHTTHNLTWLILAYISVDQVTWAKYIHGDMGIIIVLFYAMLTFYMWKRNKQ